MPPASSSAALFRVTRPLLDKSMFAAKRRVILPLFGNPVAPTNVIKGGFTTDPLKITTKEKYVASGEALREVTGSERSLEGDRSRRELEARGDTEFAALAGFIQGASSDNMITARRFQEAYNALTDNEDTFIWLCHVSMAVLNPGDVRSRLIYRHLEALVKAVTMDEMSLRTAYRFYESAIRSPAYREIAARQLETGASTRVAGIAAAADAMRRSGICRRPMTSYFELFQRITERSEANTPWGFPPLLQFEEKLQLPQRLKFFSRDNQRKLSKRSKRLITAPLTRLQGPRRFWIPPTWNMAKHRFMYPGFSPNPRMPLE